MFSLKRYVLSGMTIGKFSAYRLPLGAADAVCDSTDTA